MMRLRFLTYSFSHSLCLKFFSLPLCLPSFFLLHSLFATLHLLPSLPVCHVRLFFLTFYYLVLSSLSLMRLFFFVLLIITFYYFLLFSIIFYYFLVSQSSLILTYSLQNYLTVTYSRYKRSYKNESIHS